MPRNPMAKELPIKDSTIVASRPSVSSRAKSSKNIATYAQQARDESRSKLTMPGSLSRRLEIYLPCVTVETCERAIG